jgi:hypothetical protein
MCSTSGHDQKTTPAPSSPVHRAAALYCGHLDDCLPLVSSPKPVISSAPNEAVA